MEPAIFGVVERPSFDNELPQLHERRGIFWALASPLLGLSTRFDGADIDHVSPAIRQLREYERRRQPVQVSLGDLAADVVDEVREVVGKAVTKIDQAKGWLLETLGRDDVVAQRDIKEQGALAGHTSKNLDIGKRRLGVRSFKKAGKWWWTLSRPAKVDG